MNVLEYLLCAGLCAHCFHIIANNTVHISGWFDGERMRQVFSKWHLRSKLFIELVFILVALGFGFMFWGQEKPFNAGLYWTGYYTVLLAVAVQNWYLPYIAGAPSQLKERYAFLYERTHYILPPRYDHPRPNTPTLLIHLLYIANLILSVLVGFNLFLG